MDKGWLPDAVEPGFGHRRQNALEPGFHCVRTRWIWGFIAFQLALSTQTAMQMVPV
jgi:hypothetical protein